MQFGAGAVHRLYTVRNPSLDRERNCCRVAQCGMRSVCSDVWSLVFAFCDFSTLYAARQVCHYLATLVRERARPDLHVTGAPLPQNPPPFTVCRVHVALSLRSTDAELCALPYRGLIVALNLKWNRQVTDASLGGLANLTALNLGANRHVTDAGLADLANLTSLNLSWNWRITDAALARLRNLATFRLGWNQNITDAGLASLEHLTRLDLGANTNISDIGVARLVNLVSLDLGNNTSITYAGVASLANLASLSLGANMNFPDTDLVRLSRSNVAIPTPALLERG